MAKKKTTRTAKTPREPGVAVPQKSVVLHDHGETASVEFSRDAKGVPRWSIKLTAGREDADDLITEVLSLDERLQEESKADG